MPALNATDPRLKSAAGWIQFLKWAKKNRPQYYRILMTLNAGEMAARKRASMAGLGLDPTGTVTTTVAAPEPTWLDKISTLAEKAVQVYAGIKGEKRQDKVLELQLQQAKQGQPVANFEDFQTAIRLQHEIDLQKVSNQISPEVKQVLLWGGLGLGALILYGIFGQ